MAIIKSPKLVYVVLSSLGIECAELTEEQAKKDARYVRSKHGGKRAARIETYRLVKVKT